MHGFHFPTSVRKISNFVGHMKVGNNKYTTIFVSCMKKITNDLDIEKRLFYFHSLRRNNNPYHPPCYFSTYSPTHFIGV